MAANATRLIARGGNFNRAKAASQSVHERSQRNASAAAASADRASAKPACPWCNAESRSAKTQTIEVAKHWRHQVASDGIHIRIETGLHEVRERAAPRQRKELRPGRGSARRWHQEAPRLQKSQSGLIAHSPQQFGVEPVSRQCQCLVSLHSERQAAYKAEKRTRYLGAAQSLQSPQSHFGPVREALTEQWQIEKPLAWVVQELEAPTLRTNGASSPSLGTSTSSASIDTAVVLAGHRGGSAASAAMCDATQAPSLKSWNVGCRRRCYRHVQPTTTQPIRHCRQGGPAGRHGQQIGGERGEQRGLARPRQARNSDADRAAKLQHV